MDILNANDYHYCLNANEILHADASTVRKHPAFKRTIETQTKPTKQAQQMKILCVLYDDPSDGMPEKYPLSALPVISHYPDGMPLPSPK